MALRKCPKCEVNYLRGEETLCAICNAAAKRPSEAEAEFLLCAECGEAPAVCNQELCEACRLEQRRQAELEILADKVRQGEAEEIEELMEDDPLDADDE